MRFTSPGGMGSCLMSGSMPSARPMPSIKSRSCVVSDPPRLMISYSGASSAWARCRARRDDAVDDVAHEGVVATGRTIAVHRDRLAREKLPGKLVNGHGQVRAQPGDYFLTSLARAIYGKEPQAVHRHVVQVMVRVGQQLT